MVVQQTSDWENTSGQKEIADGSPLFRNCRLFLQVLSAIKTRKKNNIKTYAQKTKHNKRKLHTIPPCTSGNKGIRDAGSTADFRILFEILEL